MKYYLIAGEASGDLHASNLMKALLELDPEAEFRFYGGDLMQETGGVLVQHYRDMAFMGLVEVVANLRTIMGNMAHCKKDISEWKPDAVILVDYAGFNLRIAKYVKKSGIKVFYYISPKVWVWKQSRIKKLKEFTDKLFVIFPFEVEFLKKHDMDVEYYGNPLIDAKENFIKNISQTLGNEPIKKGDKPLIALLSGSRKQEVKNCLPEMLNAAENFPEYEFIVAGASSIEKSYYDELMKGSSAGFVHNRTYELLNTAYAAVVTSGTATLETAIFKVPQVVVYKMNPFNLFVGRMFVKVQFFSLVNIIARKEVVRELLQNNLSQDIATELKKITSDKKHREKMLLEYDEILKNLGDPGSSQRIAERIKVLIKE
jgi:lipid-A-disaccharide synthase